MIGRLLAVWTSDITHRVRDGILLLLVVSIAYLLQKGFSNALFDFVFQIILLIVGVLFALWYDSWGNPRLIIGIQEHVAADLSSQGHAWHLNLNVTNKPFTLPLARKKAAYNCHGTITLLNRDGTIMLWSMPLRWSDNPLPRRYEMHPQHESQAVLIADETLTAVSQFRTIPVNEKARFDIVLRFDGEPLAVGWNHESYDFLPNRRAQPKYRVEHLGDYVVQVQLHSDDDEYPIQEFVLRNTPDASEAYLKKKD